MFGKMMEVLTLFLMAGAMLAGATGVIGFGVFFGLALAAEYLP